MAFKKSAITNQGFDAINAYHRVEGIRLISKTNIIFQVRLVLFDSHFVSVRTLGEIALKKTSHHELRKYHWYFCQNRFQESFC